MLHSEEVHIPMSRRNIKQLKSYVSGQREGFYIMPCAKTITHTFFHPLPQRSLYHSMTPTTHHTHNFSSLLAIIISPRIVFPLSLFLLFSSPFFPSNGSLSFPTEFNADFLRFYISRGPVKRQKQEQKDLKGLTRNRVGN